MTWRMGIVGMGKIAQDQHLPVIAKNAAFELAAVVSQRGIHPDGVPVFSTPAEMYAGMRDLDAVAICTPPSARYAIAAQALLAGKHVLLEKPPTTTLTELHELSVSAKKLDRVLFTTWHSQFNPAVDETRKHLADCSVRSFLIEWKEDVRHWHPGQEWIWEPGGFGVFDPGINALSILTKIMPQPVFIEKSELFYPRNRKTPIAAKLAFKAADGSRCDMRADFDWRQTGEQIWNITLETDDNRIFALTSGGSKLHINGKLISSAPSLEYEAIYTKFDNLLGTQKSDVDASPLSLVADAFLLGHRIVTEPFE